MPLPANPWELFDQDGRADIANHVAGVGFPAAHQITTMHWHRIRCFPEPIPQGWPPLTQVMATLAASGYSAIFPATGDDTIDRRHGWGIDQGHYANLKQRARDRLLLTVPQALIVLAALELLNVRTANMTIASSLFVAPGLTQPVWDRLTSSQKRRVIRQLGLDTQNGEYIAGEWINNGRRASCRNMIELELMFQGSHPFVHGLPGHVIGPVALRPPAFTHNQWIEIMRARPHSVANDFERRNVDGNTRIVRATGATPSAVRKSEGSPLNREALIC